jgi:hypothetical protein
MAIADVGSGNHTQCAVDLYSADGVWVGKLVDRGLTPTLGPTHPVLGGSGAYLGTIGEHGWLTTMVPMRRTSTLESPALRQVLGGGRMPSAWPPRTKPSCTPAVATSGAG